MTAELGIRAARKQLTSRELTQVGFELFERQGYDETTVEQIADHVRVSKRTFFRYFANKEDLVLGNLEQTAELMALALGLRPRTESPWLSLRRSFDFLVDGATDDPTHARDSVRAVQTSPALKATARGKLQIWQSALVPELTTRMSGGVAFPEVRATAIAGAAVSCLEAALIAWSLDYGDQHLGLVLDSAMEGVAPLH